MKRIWIAGAAMALSACGTVNSTRLEVAAPAFTGFEVRDERPLPQRTSAKTVESHGEITSLGDDAIAPSAPELLKAWLGGKLGERLSGRTIVLSEFFVQITDPNVSLDEGRLNQAMASTPGADALSGLVARWIIGGIESARADKTVGVRIGGKVDQKEFWAGASGLFKGRVSETDINSVIAEALGNASAEIEKALRGAEGER